MQPINTVFSTAAASQVPFGAHAAQRVSARAGLIAPDVLCGIARGLELALIAVAGISTGWAGLAVEHTAAEIAAYALPSIATATVAGLMFQVMGLYKLPALKDWAGVLPRLVGGWGLAMAVLGGTLAVLAPGLGGTMEWLVAWFVAGCGAMVLARFAMASGIRQWASEGRLTRRAVVYGSGAPCQDLIKALAADPASDLRICGIYDDRDRGRGTDQITFPHQGDLEDLIDFARSSRVDVILLALPISAEMRVMELLSRLWVLPADIRLAACASRRPTSWSGVGPS